MSELKNESFFISLFNSETNSNLQDSFKVFLKSRKDQLKPNKLFKKPKKIRKSETLIDCATLRELFLNQTYEYIGVPYAKRFWTENDDEFYSPCFLDCCGLVRRVMKDLREEFGFRLGPWNQGYMYDLLPIEYTDTKDLEPGDLVFVEGIYYNEKKKPQKHDIMHVEIWVGDGDKTVGARWNKGKVQIFESYRFVSTNYEIKRFVFKSIDTWLRGICRSFCKEHPWRYDNRLHNPGKYSIFSAAEQPIEQDQDAEPDESTAIGSLPSSRD